MEEQIHRFTWRGIEIEARYTPLKWGVIAHLEIASIAPERAPLPITETGYLSDFHEAGTVESNEGTLVEQIIRYLDHEATKPEWKRHVESCRQFLLF